jgi:hypothetical protein
MLRKNTFKPNSLKNNNNFNKLKYGNQILWKYETFKYFKNFITSATESENINFSEYKNYKIIGTYKINKNLKISEFDCNKMYIITDSEYKKLYMSINITLPLFWYTFINRKQFYKFFDIIYSAYNPKNYIIKYMKKIRGFMGTTKMLHEDINDIKNNLILNKYSETLIWGSHWHDHPFRELYRTHKINSRNDIIITHQALKQINDNTHHINIRSQYSKSIITIEEHYGAFIVNVQYDPIMCENEDRIKELNKVYKTEYPNDMPLDVILTLISRPFITHNGLLKLSPLTEYNIIMSFFVANCQSMYNEIQPLIKEIIKTTKDDNIVNIANIFLTNMESDNILLESNTEDILYDKLADVHMDKKKIKEIQKDITKKLEKKLSQLKIDESSFKDYLTEIINN